MMSYNPGDALKQAKDAILFSGRVKKIIKKAKKFERRYEAEIAKLEKLRDEQVKHPDPTKPNLRYNLSATASRIRKSYINLSKKFPGVVK